MKITQIICEEESFADQGALAGGVGELRCSPETNGLADTTVVFFT